MLITHGNNNIWEMELFSYEKVRLSEMYEDSHIIILTSVGGDLYPYIFISRVQENEWKIVGAVHQDLRVDSEEIKGVLTRIHEIDTLYNKIDIDGNGRINSIQLRIMEDMELSQAYHCVLICMDLIVNLFNSYKNKKVSKLAYSYISRRLPIYFRAMKQVKLELENYVSDSIANKEKICDICGRVKDIDSICEKIARKEIDQFDVFTSFDDIAGTRCTCEYLDDVYELLEYIKSNPLLNVLVVEDKIDNPSSEGYRGIHVIVSTEVYYCGVLENVKVEIQLRTAFQNAWSMKTHALTYKQDMSKLGEISETMRKLSDTLYDADKISSEMRRQKELLQN